MSYLNKFKEKNPIETVDKIKDFFKQREYDIFVTDIHQSEIETWSCHLVLYYKNNFILSSNGKGMTQEYCLASGYAELYERFCNKETIKNTLFFKWKSTNFYKNYTSQTPNHSYLNNIICPEDQEEYFKNFFFNVFPQSNYINLIDDKKLTYNENILNMLYGSIGMAAGNNLEEALNQGISEICEKEVCHQFYLNKPKFLYYLDIDNINNLDLKQKIKSIKNLNYDIYIFDLSYNYNLPVLMSLLIDKTNYCTKINLGAFPVFDIALERIITELYQGIFSYKDFSYDTQCPNKTHDPFEILADNGSSITQASYFYEDFDTYSEEINQYNNKIFLEDKDYTNEQILSYFKDLFKKHNYNLYYTDNSLDEEIKAIHCFCPEFIYWNPAITSYEKSSNSLKKLTLQKAYQFLKIMFMIMLNENDDDITQELFDFFQKCEQDNVDYILLSNLIGKELLFPASCFFSVPLYMYFQSLPELKNDAFNQTLFYKFARKYLFIQNYYTSGYSIEEIKNIFKNIFNEEIQNEDIQKCFNKKYLIKKIYVEPNKIIIHSQEFENEVKTYYN